MKRTMDVCLGSDAQAVGSILYNSDGARERAAFAYHAEWLANSRSFSLDPALPLVTGAQFHKPAKEGCVFHSIIADTEPDGWGKRVILRAHSKRADKKRQLCALDFLLAVDDYSRVGALRFRDETGVFQDAPEDGRRTAPPLIELQLLLNASRAVELSTETAKDLAYLRGRGTSLGGLRPKCTVIDDDGLLSIGKFPSVADTRAVTHGEVLALRLAKLAGIDAAAARIVESGGTPVALIRRFDRTAEGERKLYASAATMLGVEASGPVEASYTDIVDVIRQKGESAQRDIEELWRRIAFSILISNVDDHLLNHGFLYAGNGHWSLAPAFDLNPFPDRVRELKTWISPETGPTASIEALRAVAPYFRISPARARQILREIEAAVSRWRNEGQALGMSRASLDAFADAFEHAEREEARL